MISFVRNNFTIKGHPLPVELVAKEIRYDSLKICRLFWNSEIYCLDLTLPSMCIGGLLQIQVLSA